jgi:hypothetical protein
LLILRCATPGQISIMTVSPSTVVLSGALIHFSVKAEFGQRNIALPRIPTALIGTVRLPHIDAVATVGVPHGGLVAGVHLPYPVWVPSIESLYGHVVPYS